MLANATSSDRFPFLVAGFGAAMLGILAAVISHGPLPSTAAAGLQGAPEPAAAQDVDPTPAPAVAPELEPRPEPAVVPEPGLSLLPTPDVDRPVEQPAPVMSASDDPSMQAFDEVRKWMVWHPLELLEAERRFAAVESDYPGSIGAEAAHNYYVQVLAKAAERAARTRASLQESADSLMQDGECASAAQLFLDEAALFPDSLRGPFEAAAEALSMRCRASLERELAAIDDPAERQLLLSSHRERATPDVRAAIDGLIAELALEEDLLEQTDAFGQLRSDVLDMLAAGNFEGARKAVLAHPESASRSLKRKLRTLSEGVIAVADEAARVHATLSDKLDSRMQLERADASKLTGRLQQVSSDLRLTLKGESWPIGLDEISEASLDSLLRAPETRQEWIARTALYAACGFADTVERALQSPLAQPVAGVSIRGLLLHAQSFRAESAFAELRAQTSSHAQASHARRFLDRHAQSAWTWKNRQQVTPVVREILIDAALREDPSAYFAGSLKLESDGRVALAYDFELPSELDDFSIERPSEALPGAGSVLLKGEMRHRARFTGPLEVALRFAIDWEGEVLPGELRELRRDQVGSLLFELYSGGPRSAHFVLWSRDEIEEDLNGDGELENIPRPCHTLARREDLIEGLEDATRAAPPYQKKVYELVCNADENHIELKLAGKDLFDRQIDLPGTAGSLVLGAINTWRMRIDALVIRGRIDPDWLREKVAAGVEEELRASLRRVR